MSDVDVRRAQRLEVDLLAAQARIRALEVALARAESAACGQCGAIRHPVLTLRPGVGGSTWVGGDRS